MTYRAVVFDLDGTLLDTLADIGGAMNRALQTLGFDPAPVEQYRLRLGWGVHVLAEKSLPPQYRTPDMIERCAGEMQREYLRRPAQETVPYDGVRKLLTALVRRAVPFSVISNKPDTLTREVVRRVLGEFPFAYIQGDLPDVPNKPDPSSTLKAAAAMGVAPQDTVFLGDSEVDMATALAARMVPVGAAWGLRGERELREAGAREVIAQPSELLAILQLQHV